MLGLYRDNGRGNGNYCTIVGYILGCSREEGNRLYIYTPVNTKP